MLKLIKRCITKVKEYLSESKRLTREEFFLRRYYAIKQDEFVCDIYYSNWGTLYEKDIGIFKTMVTLNNGVVVNLVLVGLEKPGYYSKGAMFDVEYIEGCPNIRRCTYEEFREHYSELILYLGEKERDFINGEEAF